MFEYFTQLPIYIKVMILEYLTHNVRALYHAIYTPNYIQHKQIISDQPKLYTVYNLRLVAIIRPRPIPFCMCYHDIPNSKAHHKGCPQYKAVPYYRKYNRIPLHNNLEILEYYQDTITHYHKKPEKLQKLQQQSKKWVYVDYQEPKVRKRKSRKSRYKQRKKYPIKPRKRYHNKRINNCQEYNCYVHCHNCCPCISPVDCSCGCIFCMDKYWSCYYDSWGE